MFKRYILKTHQVLGSILSLAFVVWFVSGFFMIFSGFPHASAENKFNKLSPLNSSNAIITLTDTAFSNADKIVLEKFNEQPVYRIKWHNGGEAVLDAAIAVRIDTFQSEELDKLIGLNYKVPVAKKIVINDFDAWIPWSRFKKYFPIHKYYLKDSTHTVVYVSAITGAIVQETTRKQRWMARFGAIPHWYYFKSLRLKRDLWINVIIWISGLGSIMSLTGIVLGIYHFRKKRRRKDNAMFRFSPYKKKWYKWHHVTGFVFGLFVFTFVFSGMMSLQKVPKVIVPIKGKVNYIEIWNNKRFQVKDFKLPVKSLLTMGDLDRVKKIEYSLTHQRPCYLVYQTEAQKPAVVYADGNQQPIVYNFTQTDVEEELLLKFSGIQFNIIKLTDSDGYYNKRKNKTWPVYKVEIDDADKTWLYINPSNLEIVKTYNKNTRTRKWLYNGLHSLDFKVLAKHETLRKSLLFILSVFGTIVSISGLVIGYKYVRRKIRKMSR